MKIEATVETLRYQASDGPTLIRLLHLAANESQEELSSFLEMLDRMQLERLQGPIFTLWQTMREEVDQREAKGERVVYRNPFARG